MELTSVVEITPTQPTANSIVLKVERSKTKIAEMKAQSKPSRVWWVHKGCWGGFLAVLMKKMIARMFAPMYAKSWIASPGNTQRMEKVMSEIEMENWRKQLGSSPATTMFPPGVVSFPLISETAAIPDPAPWTINETTSMETNNGMMNFGLMREYWDPKIDKTLPRIVKWMAAKKTGVTTNRTWRDEKKSSVSLRFEATGCGTPRTSSRGYSLVERYKDQRLERENDHRFGFRFLHIRKRHRKLLLAWNNA